MDIQGWRDNRSNISKSNARKLLVSSMVMKTIVFLRLNVKIIKNEKIVKILFIYVRKQIF